MLNEKTKSFIETLASDMQKEIDVKSPNRYTWETLENFIKSIGCQILDEQNENQLYGNVIKLKFKIEKQTTDIDNKQFKILFHELWHYILGLLNPENDASMPSFGYTEDSLSPEEMAANYFARAMLMPEEFFVRAVIANTSGKGMCNIFKVAEEFRVEYRDVISRGNDLKLWSEKGGI